MENVKLGKIIDENEHRDAIHIAIAPVIATEKLWPGQHIGFVDKDCERVSGVYSVEINHIGIVDPFLKTYVFPSQWFFMLLYPQTITSLRHEWTHPAFEPVQDTDNAASLQWMKNFATKHHYYPNYYTKGEEPVNYTAEEIINHATDFLETGKRHVQQGSESLRDDTDSVEFWQHYEAITNIGPGDTARTTVPFCCTC